MAFLYKILSVSEEVSLSPADQPVDPMLWSLLMVGAFAAVLVGLSGGKCKIDFALIQEQIECKQT